MTDKITFSEYKKNVIDKTEETTAVVGAPAYLWLHLDYMPRGIFELTDKSLKTVRLPSRIKNFNYNLKVIRISSTLFRGNETVTDIILPLYLERIPNYAFEGCSSLKHIVIPKSVKKIFPSAFCGCTSLTDIYYEGTIEEWKSMEKTFYRHEVEFNRENYPGTPVAKMSGERIFPLPGAENVLTATVHFECDLRTVGTAEFSVRRRGKKDLSELFYLMADNVENG